MASTDILQTLLHTQLASDASAVRNLPHVLSLLSEQALESSPHLGKWSNRINALIQSRESAMRWAGMTLALRCSMLCKTVMMNSAQAWVIAVLPILSRNESLALWKVGIKLVAYIFSKTIGLSEFQRQVAMPNILKFSSGLMSLADKQSNEELKILCLDALSLIVPLYPSIHRPLSQALSALSLNLLNGSSHATPHSIVNSASRLHVSLHATGGKVGGATLWRSGVDETIVFCSTALEALRTTYKENLHGANIISEPLNHVLYNLDRLYCGTELLCQFLQVSVSRPVPVPVRALVDMCLSMLKVTEINAVEFDPFLRMAEASAVRRIHELGCSLAVCLSKCLKYKLAPCLNRLLSVIAFHLEQRYPSSGQLPFVRLIPVLFSSCLPPSDPFVVGRLIKSILPTLSSLLSEKATNGDTVSSFDVVGGKKGKKRARAYEGDEVLKVERSALCEDILDGELVLAVLDALPLLLRTPDLSSYLHSLSSRLLISLMLAIPHYPASLIASDALLGDKILQRVNTACVDLCSESGYTLSSTLPLILESMKNGTTLYNSVEHDKDRRQKAIELMLHPRLPPLLRPLLTIDSIALTQNGEGREERKTRENLGLCTIASNMEMGESDDAPVASVPTVSVPSAQLSLLQTPRDIPIFKATLNQKIQHTSAPAATISTSQALQGHATETESNFLENDHAELVEPRVNDYPPPARPLTQVEPSSKPLTDKAPSTAQTSTPGIVESERMAVEDDEDDENFAVPPINMESDTESDGD